MLNVSQQIPIANFGSTNITKIAVHILHVLVLLVPIKMHTSLKDEVWKQPTQLPSILAPSTDLLRIQTLHSLFTDLGADKTFTTCWSGGTIQVQVQV